MPLYLTKDEKKLYDKLPAALKKAWGGEVVEETGTAWETEEELNRRILALSGPGTPGAKEFAEKIRGKMERKENWQQVDLSEIPQEMLPAMLYILGARGLSTMIQAVLAEANPHVESVTTFSEVCHILLQKNSNQIL